ncbi:EmrB/QacA subfamily drug resistance transporter [Clostridium acetobutylicum]|uniref:Predicted permease n=1 Tax=Clostridium acetobutylicum (strain ATCC 824 / DSM 792 / JCM 1419 / IAM 19013 / LMG 5710 / NBRC 13948 / NRRL B-527 / VKM B-1787 / 2291 / W) TaxID=272562 RepID=Q97DV2_CLOAB|nr:MULTISPECIES: MFS transporter [Clostridium]AAK81300.1 Predicted permease [Clostridium acetobutylicum ATCC 824]ADZ22408.1 permease [Clostridium acetobutylicum EA 2018]AEI32802.1 permease [Clostridium acetobutylicum DSM 1731]AWV81035.1 MFS transporter [Clostridium acetobutylicum]MBC2395548.1 MFS transporter [Clostridium acetobutylicum]
MSKDKKRIIALAIFLLGIFMGAIDSGIVSPARDVIRSSFGIGESLSVWMVTIYTLAYAVSMPIVSKLSDRYGRKKVYVISIATFALGSFLCGVSNFYGNYTFFLVARVIQAIGGGGIMPIANAFIGVSFPPEKRGTALGFVGGIYGIATILGPTMGSSVLNLAGNNHWGWIFFINLPISLIILALSVNLKENLGEAKKKMDLKGSIVLSAMILSLMYALTNLNFSDIVKSLRSSVVYPFLIVFFITLPIFIVIEKKAEDPILNLRYFKEKQILLTLILGFITGVGLMAVIFIPQFAENILKLKTGNGGYLVTFMSVFAGVSAPLGGKFIDKYSAKLVTALGMICTVFGTFFLAFYTTSNPNFISIMIGLVFVGFGMGFTMGTPLNYLMLSFVDEKESASALSTLSLIRSIGVAVSPNIMINFISEAGKRVQGNIMSVMPQISVPVFLQGKSAVRTIDISKLSGSGKISNAAISKFQSADVTNIVKVLKEFAASIIDKMLPGIKAQILRQMGPTSKMAPHIDLNKVFSSWKADYLNKIDQKRAVIESTFQSTISSGYKNMFIAAGIIALVGFIAALMLENKKMRVKNNI